MNVDHFIEVEKILIRNAGDSTKNLMPAVKILAENLSGKERDEAMKKMAFINCFPANKSLELIKYLREKCLEVKNESKKE